MTYSEELIVAERRAEAAERKLADMRIILARAQADLARERDRAERWKLLASGFAATAGHDAGCTKPNGECSCQFAKPIARYGDMMADEASEARDDAETCEVTGEAPPVHLCDCPRCTKPSEGVTEAERRGGEMTNEKPESALAWVKSLDTEALRAWPWDEISPALTLRSLAAHLPEIACALETAEAVAWCEANNISALLTKPSEFSNGLMPKWMIADGRNSMTGDTLPAAVQALRERMGEKA